MICCTNCFKDLEIRSMIQSLGKEGRCETCHSDKTFTYDTEEDDALTPLFEDLLNVYKPKTSLPPDYPRERLSLIKDELHDNWNIFNVNKHSVYRIVTEICRDLYQANPDIFDTPVGIEEFEQKDYLEEKSLLKAGDWEDFSRSIKTENRFHTSNINTNVLKVICSYVSLTYKAGMTFYRARISSKDGHGAIDMGAPPCDKATAGRANPEGISHLYLSDSLLTTLKEIRASALDYVTVGKFVLKEDIRVVDLTSIDQIGAFSGLGYVQHAINREHLRNISKEIARPLRRGDSRLDYLPTQYVIEFIKSIRNGGQNEYQGIKYGSTLSTGGFNLAIFDQSIFQCQSVSVVDIRDVTYTSQTISGDLQE